MPGKIAITTFVVAALVLACLAMGFAPTADAMLRERTVHYWAYTEGDGIPIFRAQNGCSCVVGPCNPTWEIVGERTYFCDGTSEEWGYVDHECASTTVTFGPVCVP